MSVEPTPHIMRWNIYSKKTAFFCFTFGMSSVLSHSACLPYHTFRPHAALPIFFRHFRYRRSILYGNGEACDLMRMILLYLNIPGDPTFFMDDAREVSHRQVQLIMYNNCEKVFELFFL